MLFLRSIQLDASGTLIAVERELTAEGIEETYKTVSPLAGVDHSHVRLWEAEG